MAVKGSNGDEGYMLANAAMMKLESHEKICGERYKQIVANQNLSVQDREKLRELVLERFNHLNAFMWKIALSIVGFLVVTVAGLIVFIANNSFVFTHP
jgi:hypothetical protein